MGWSPRQVDESSLWEFGMAAAGFAQSHGAEIDTALSDAEVEEIGRWIDG